MAFFHICVAPAVTVSHNAFALGHSVYSYLILVIDQVAVAHLWSILCAPLVGLVILAYRRWSLPVFWFLKLAVFFGNADHIRKLIELGMYEKVFSAIGLSVLSLVFVSYFLVPTVSKSFSDSKCHWWLRKRRFNLQLPCSFRSKGEVYHGVISNISESGILIKTITTIDISKISNLEFKYENMNFSLDAEYVNSRSAANTFAFSFSNLSKVQNKKLKKLTKKLKIRGKMMEGDKISLKNEFIKVWRELKKGNFSVLFPKIVVFRSKEGLTG
ncbi:PilZ domain-containing protein [bacterium]|nr:PilZ domain-containing protein [bacterium]